MAAMKELLINGFVTGAAICGCDSQVDHESMVVGSFLSLRDLMTVEAIDVLLRVGAHLKLVNDGELGVQVALGAFATGAHECGARLFDDDARPARVNQVRRQD